MHGFVVQVHSVYKGLFYWLHWFSYISNMLLAPIISVVTYAVVGRFVGGSDQALNFAIGVIMSQMSLVAIGGVTQTYAYDRNFGTIAFLYISPANRLVNYLSRGVLHFPNTLVVFASGLFGVWVVTDVALGRASWGALLITAAVTGASLVGFSQFLGVFAIVTRDWLNVMAVAMGLLFALSGVIIPVEVFPTALQKLCQCLPMTAGLAAVRAAVIGVPIAELQYLIVREVVVGCAYFLVGFVGFVGFERMAKRSGSLELETH